MSLSNKSKAFTAIALSSALLVACGGGGGGGGGQKSFSTTASLGALVGASCSAAEIGSNLTAQGTTNANGVANFTFPAAYQGPSIVTCTGGTYFDEATNTTITLNVPVRSVVPANQTSAAVTPLTDLVAQQVVNAIQAAGLTPQTASITNAQITQVAQDIAGVFAPGINILTPPTPVSNANQLNNLGTNNADQYAAALAAFSQLAADLGYANTHSLLTPLVIDSNDGIIGNQLNDQAGNPVANIIAAVDAAIANAPISDAAKNELEDEAAETPRDTAVQSPTVTPGTGTGGTGGTN